MHSRAHKCSIICMVWVLSEGDVLYIPSMWGHSVLNIHSDWSMAKAVEFSGCDVDTSVSDKAKVKANTKRYSAQSHSDAI